MTPLELDVSIERPGFRLAAEAKLDMTGTTALFGASGTGKTTLLRAIAGLEKESRGTIRFNGIAWQDGSRFVPVHERRIGFVFQDGRLFAHLDVRGNLEFGRRRGRAAARLGFDDVIAALDLAPLLHRRPGSLSGGEAQRVSIGRALLADPALLLMDEPVNALDIRRKREVLRYIERIPELFALPILYVTHSIDEVTRLANSVVILRDGSITAAGPVGDVLGDIEHWSLTGRLDAGAVVDARVLEQTGGMSTLSFGTERLRLPQVDAPVGARIRFRIRARDVAIATERPHGLSIRNVIAATILSADISDALFAELLLDASGQKLRARITREAFDELGLATGARVYALIKSVALESRLLGTLRPEDEAGTA